MHRDVGSFVGRGDALKKIAGHGDSLRALDVEATSYFG